jgi:hypothetical protein
MLRRNIIVAAVFVWAFSFSFAFGETVPDETKPPLPGSAAPDVARVAGNDFRLKVLFKLDVSYQLDDASLSANTPLALRRPTVGAPSVDAQAAALAAQTDTLSSDHVLGTEGLGWSHLRTYYNGFLLHRFEDFGGAPSPTFPTAYLKGAQQTAYDVRSGYAEINGFRDQGFWSRAFLRAGRQFRYGAGIATFDGLALGYAGPGVEVTAWGGRRSPRFLDDLDPGYVAGADAALHFDALTKTPIDLAVNYLVYAVPQQALRQIVAASLRWRLRSGARLLVSASTFDFAGARAHVAFTLPLGRPAQLKLYYDLKIGRDAVYDFVAGFGLPAPRYFTLPDVEPRSRFGVRVDHTIAARFEYAVFADFNVVHGSDDIEGARGWTGPTAFDATYEQVGAIARVLGGWGLVPEIEYWIRFDQRETRGVDGGTEGGRFSDTSEAGEHRMQELRGDLRARPVRALSISVGAIYRVRDYVTRYAPTGSETTVENDTTVAGELSVEYVIRRLILLRARYEVGQDSAAFAPELGLVQRSLATVGGRF